MPHDRGRVLPWIELGDAARAVVVAVERGRPGQAYNIADPTPLGFRAHLLRVAETSGLPRPMSYAHDVMSTTLRVPTAKAERELGWIPVHPDARDGLAAMRAGTR